MDISRYTKGDCRCCVHLHNCKGGCAFRYTDKKVGRYKPSPGNPFVETESQGIKVSPLSMLDVRGLSIVGDGSKRKWRP